MNQPNIAGVPYADMGDFGEDERIETIGKTVMEKRMTVAFMTDSDPGKADRYIAKLKAKFKGIRILDIMAGPISGVITVKVGPPDAAVN